MADAIGILAFTLHAVHKIYGVVQSVKRAPEAVRTIAREASRVESLLTMMLSASGDTASSLTVSRAAHSPLFKRLVEEAQTLATAVEVFLDKATKLNVDGIREPKILWPLYSGRAKELAGQFRAFYLSLSAVYAIQTS